LHLTVFDVEHGACALLTCDNGTRLMVDCGHNATTGWRPGTYLRRSGVTHLDMLAITNYDEDHVSGLPDLNQHIHIGWLLRNRSVTPDVLRYLKTEDGMGPGIDTLVDMTRTYGSAQPGVPEPHFQDVQREVFYMPYPEFDDENNLSLVLFLRIRGIGFLFHQCKPYWIVISDKGYMYGTQETVPYYAAQARGGVFRGEIRKVLTTRNDGAISFNFQDGRWSAA
jgi:beta-lactamase superfamily II metal-dependent hydrolase